MCIAKVMKLMKQYSNRIFALKIRYSKMIFPVGVFCQSAESYNYSHKKNYLRKAASGESAKPATRKKRFKRLCSPLFMLSLTVCITADSRNKQRQVSTNLTISGIGTKVNITAAIRVTEQKTKSNFLGSENGFGNSFPR